MFQVFDRLLLLQRGGKTVFFGEIGHHATNVIEYFENSGSRKCAPEENPAEYMLDVVGAGATATTDRDWNDAWLKSSLCKKEIETLERMHEDGRKHPPVGATFDGIFAVPWAWQIGALVVRQHQYYWRAPTYLISKLMLNVIGGLFIGFSFFKSKTTIQGTQNKVFVSIYFKMTRRCRLMIRLNLGDFHVHGIGEWFFLLSYESVVIWQLATERTACQSNSGAFHQCKPSFSYRADSRG